MPWRPLPRIAVAVAIYPFAASFPADLPLEIGDDLYIIEQGGKDGDWYRGYLVAPPSLLSGLTSVKGQTLEARVFSGIFPKCCIEIREHLGDVLPESQANGFLVNGESGKSDMNGGDSPQYQNTRTHKNSVSRRESNDSVRRRNGTTTNGDVFMESGAPTRFIIPGPQTLARKLSHRSITSSRSRNSPAPATPIPDTIPNFATKRPQAPVPMLKIGDESPTSSTEPLVDEIASCLREWHSTNVHELLLGRRYSTLGKLAELVKRLNLARRQLLHGVMTDLELVRLREEIVWDLVGGNKLLSNEVIVRDPSQSGRLLTGEDSPVEISKLQSTMSLLDRPPTFNHDPITFNHLLVELRSVAYNGLVSPSLLFQLYFRDQGDGLRPLTETFNIDVPTNEDFEKLASAGALRTLFVDLSQADIEAAALPGNGLYLVVWVQSQSPAREAYVRNHENSSGPRPLTGSTHGASSTKGGRQSLMWAQKQFGSVRNRNNSPRPDLANSMIEDSRNGVNGANGAPVQMKGPATEERPRPATQPGVHYVRRTLGAGIIDLKQTFESKRALDHRLYIWAPAPTSTDVKHRSDDNWDELIRELVYSRNKTYSKAKSIEHIHLLLQPFDHPNADELVAKTPTLLQNTITTSKLLFSGTPSRPRSDIYLEITEAILPPHALLAHPERGTVPLNADLEYRNVQLTLEVRRNNGDRIERCIFPSSDNPGQTAWRTTAVSRGEPWSQLIKIVLSAEDVSRSHLIMSIAEAPGFPFALGWTPLWTDGAFLRDGAHVTRLYLYDKITSGIENGRGAYLSYPWSSRSKDGSEREESVTGPVATLKLETKLCSTYFSQDKVLIGLSRWRYLPGSEILVLLKLFPFVPEIEIVKMIGDVFDALFGILGLHASQHEYEDGIFSAIVTVLGIVYDRRFNLGPFVDEYAEAKFDHPAVAPCMIRSYLRLLANPADANEARLLRATFKVGRQIFKFILRARQKQSVEEATVGATTQSAFRRDLNSIFHALEALMKESAPSLIGTKTLLVQHMPSWLPELKPAFTESEIFEIASSFVISCEDVRGKLLLHKLVLVFNLTSQNLFSEPEVREKVVYTTPRWINRYWGFTNTVTDQWRDQVRLCCTIASKQVAEISFEGADYMDKIIQSYNALLLSPDRSKANFSLLFPATYPFPTKRLSSKSGIDESRVELAALLASLADTSFTMPKDTPSSEVAAMVSATLEMVLSILSGSAFPTSWISLFVYHHRSMLQVLENLFDLMVKALIPSPDDADTFNTDLWRKFLTTLLILVRSDTLALETFPEQKRRAVWKVAGDVREQGASLLRQSWEAIGWDSSADEQKRYGLQRLGGYQVQYVPKLVSPVVELCLSVHEGLRSISIKILQSMIISEWTLNEDLSLVQAEMVESLDMLFKSKNIGESMVQKMFINELLDSFEQLARMPLDPLWQAVRDMVSIVDELLELLGAVHNLDISETLRVMNTLQLMNFYRDLQKEDIFIRYVHQLADVQARNGNKKEAGLALSLHAEQYTWDPIRVVPLRDPPFPEQTSFDRKEYLFFEMIKFFEEGSAWENALAAYQELAQQYESTHYDLAKLARAQRSMATIYERISSGDFQTPRFFRVTYHGSDFPTSLQDRHFIYEAGPNERQSVFIDRMRQLHPAAQIITKGEVSDDGGQSLQVLPISPLRDLQHPIYQQPKVPQAARDYAIANKIYRFAVTSKRHPPSAGVQDQWIEKTVYSTQEAFPTILRRSEIVAADVITLTPLQTAVERTTRKTSELSAIEKRAKKGDETALSQFYEAIALSVDSTSPASVSQYRQLLPVKSSDGYDEEDDIDDNDNDDEEDEGVETPSDPMETALSIALLDHVSLLKHCLSRPPTTTNQRTHSTLIGQFSSTFAPELAILTPAVQNVEDNTHDLLSSPPLPFDEVATPTFEQGLSSPVGVSAELIEPRQTMGDSHSKPSYRFSFNAFKESFASNPSKQVLATSPEEPQRMNGSISVPSDVSFPSSRNNSMQNSQQRPKLNHKASSGKSVEPGKKNVMSIDASDHVNGTERPSTSQSNPKSFVGSGGGAVRRRLSLLRIGRTGSGGSKERSRENVHVEAIQE